MSETLAPAGWRDRVEALSGWRRETAVVGLVVGGMVFTGMGMWARGDPAVIAPLATATPLPQVSVSATGGQLFVHVAGAVRRPGVVHAPPGARVADVIALAGGALERADLDLLNLAAFVSDGSQVLVPVRGGSPTSAPTPATGADQSATVNLNTADQALLETVPGIGPVKAGAIIAFRSEIGGFGSVEQLLEVSGIGPATLESLRPYVSV